MPLRFGQHFVGRGQLRNEECMTDAAMFRENRLQISLQIINL
jgi:hypothetical protein